MKWVLRICIYGALAIILFSLFTPVPFKVGFALLTGWAVFLVRTLPKVSVSWSGLGMGVLCSLILIGTLHSFCKWFARSRNGEAWKWGSTLAIFGLAAVLFLATMGITGLVHQIAWLAASNEKWMVRAPSMERYDLMSFSMQLGAAVERNGWNTEDRNAYWGDISTSGRYSREVFQTLFLPDAGTITNVVIFHRDPRLWERIGFSTISRGEGHTYHRWEEIRQYVPLMPERQ